MRNKTARSLRRYINFVLKDKEGYIKKEAYKNIKKQWNKIPRNKRKFITKDIPND